MWPIVSVLLLVWFVVVLLLIASYRRELLRLWREPVLRHPVLIIESDDWGAGPPAQAAALYRLRELLAGFRDSSGHPPVMTLGVILGVADTRAIAASGVREYHRVTLADPPLAGVKRAMLAGSGSGVFALQLHGMEHYRPVSVLKAAAEDAALADWLVGPELPQTEGLQPSLQSRWTDASHLPSEPLTATEIGYLVTEETAAFSNTFGRPARVVVPPTFQWTEVVERAWARAGIHTLVSPGRRQVARDAAGGLVDDGSRQANGGRGEHGMTYLIRDAWFEPAMGHRASKGLVALAERTALGRPTLLETHRFNFLGEAAEDSMAELGTLLQEALAAHPQLRFVSSEELGEALAERDPQWLQAAPLKRIGVFLQRLRQVPRLGRLARLGAFGVPLGLAQRLFPHPG